MNELTAKDRELNNLRQNPAFLRGRSVSYLVLSPKLPA